MAKQTITVDVECPDGWELIRWDFPDKGEMCINGLDGTMYEASGSYYKCWIIRRKRWRAELGGVYYTVSDTFEVEEIEEHGDTIDNELYNALNYFQTGAEAQPVADAFKNIIITLR